MANVIAEKTFMLLDIRLKWTKSNVGRINTVYQDVDLSEVIMFASCLSDMLAKTKEISIEFDLPEEMHAQCDVDMIKTIMRNLLMNALKFSNEGGKIYVSATESDDFVTVSVRVLGAGIKEEDLCTIFNPEVIMFASCLSDR